MMPEPDKAGTEGEGVQGSGDGIDAGLRSLGHCMSLLRNIPVLETTPIEISAMFAHTTAC